MDLTNIIVERDSQVAIHFIDGQDFSVRIDSNMIIGFRSLEVSGILDSLTLIRQLILWLIK